MRGRVLLLISLGLNLVLGVWLWRVNLESPGPPEAESPLLPPPTLSGSNVIRTNVVIRRQNFVWDQIESEDFPVYIANLRNIGCPEATIRDIIVAEVNQIFIRRRATEVINPVHQWWRAEPDPEVTAAAVEKLRALEHERRALLTRLLGPDWESADYPLPALAALAPLDGPVLGGLSPEEKLAVERIERSAVERQERLLAERLAQGLDPNPAELAQLRQDTREELAAVLNPEALEEYLLRYSAEARRLREGLRGFEVTPEEFREIFRAVDPIDLQLDRLGESADPAARRQLEALQREREAAFASALGADRHEEFRTTQDPLYRRAQETVSLSGVDLDRILPLAAIYHLSDLEEQRIQNSAELSPEEKAEQLETARLAQQGSIRQLLGEAGYARYLERTTR